MEGNETELHVPEHGEEEGRVRKEWGLMVRTEAQISHREQEESDGLEIAV